MIKGQSFTIGIIFDAGYDKDRIQSLELNIGEKTIGKLSDNTIIFEDDIYICRLTSQQTSFLSSGNIPVTVHLQDSILGVRKPEAGTLEISTSKNKTTSEKKNEIVDYFIELSIDDDQITSYAILQTMYRGLPGTTPHVGENGNWFVSDTDTGIKAQGIQGEKGDPGNFFQGQYNLIINKQDTVWVDGWLWIDTVAKTNQKIIDIGYMAICTGIGTEQLKPIVHYPAGLTYESSSIKNGFYLKDVDGRLSENIDFEFIDLRYNILTDTVSKYDGLTKLIGTNVIFDENSGQISHSKAGVKTFNAVYPDFGGNKIEAIKDELTNHDSVNYLFTPTYARIKHANIIGRPYLDGSSMENIGSNADILTIASHYDNTFARRDITANSTTFIQNVIAVGSCGDGEPDPLTWTSFGNGLEFSEKGNNLGLNAAYPNVTFKRDLGWGAVNGTTYTDATPTRNFNNIFELEIGSKIYIGIYNSEDDFRLQERTVISLNENIIEVDEPFDALTPGENYLYIDAHIGTVWQPVADNQKYYQSPVTSIVMAKFRKIQDETGASWHICRMAARATASNNGIWDMYRGFGVIDTEAAIQWIKDNYTENEDYLNQLADNVERTRGIDQMLSYDNITENTPVAKRMLELLKAAWDNAVTWISTNGANILNHIANGNIHVTAQDKATWSAKQNALPALPMYKFVNDNNKYSHTGNTNATVVKSVVIPANTLKTDSVIWFNLLNSWTNNSNQKTFSIRFNSYQIFLYVWSTSAMVQSYFPIRLKDGKAVIGGQVYSAANYIFNGPTNEVAPTIVDFGGVASDIAIEFRVQLANGADTASYESIHIIIEP